MIQPRLSPKARELLRRLEEREAKAKARQSEVATAPRPRSKPSMSNCLMSPEELDKLLGKPSPGRKRRR